MQSDLRGPKRGRGRVRGQVAVSSVLPVAAVVIVVGGLFWASIWMVVRAPTSSTSTPAVASAEVIDATVPSPASGQAAATPPRTSGQAAAARNDNDDDFYADDDDGPVISDVRAAALPASEAIEPTTEDDDLTNEDVASDGVAAGSLDEPAEVATSSTDGPAGIVISPAGPAEVASSTGGPVEVASASGGLAVVLLGPIQGPEVPEGFVWGDAAGEQVADASGQSATKAAEVSVRAAELTAQAAELTARTADLTARLEGAAAKIEELQARLEASSASLTARPVPSPVAVPGATPRTTETVAARAGQAPAVSAAASASAATTVAAASSAAGTRAPWVVLPQPQPGSRVTAGPLVLETRARGEAPITEIRLQLDGVALSVALERRDDTTWRGRASTRVSPGPHTVAVAVVDGQGRVGSYRWQFDAGS